MISIKQIVKRNEELSSHPLAVRLPEWSISHFDDGTLQYIFLFKEETRYSSTKRLTAAYEKVAPVKLNYQTVIFGEERLWTNLDRLVHPYHGYSRDSLNHEAAGAPRFGRKKIVSKDPKLVETQKDTEKKHHLSKSR